MKARSSMGLTVTNYFGGFGESSENTVELSCLDADKTIGFAVKQDAKLQVGAPGYIQFAVLFTTTAGERQIRVFNYTVSVIATASKRRAQTTRRVLCRH